MTALLVTTDLLAASQLNGPASHARGRVGSLTPTQAQHRAGDPRGRQGER
ncbi:MAG: hypothetical protein AAF790_14140 [Planctomycetota bacterium]